MRFGDIIVEKPADREAFMSLIAGLDLRPPVVIKPNWGTSSCFTEAEIIDWVLESVDGDAIVVESYGWARSEEAIRTSRPGSKRRGDLRNGDRWFLKYSGVGDILNRHRVEFLNITEENWGHRTADPDDVRKIVEAKYAPVYMEEMYGFVPKALFDIRGCDFLSLSKVKRWLPPIHVSLTVKNFFGMLPGPGRLRYHGRKNSRIDRSIVDIYKIYASLFDVKGVVEAIKSASVAESLHSIKIHENPGFASASKHPLELDVFVAALLGLDPDGIGYLKHASSVFGEWSKENMRRGLEAGIDVL